LGNYLIAWVLCVEIQHFDKLPTSLRQLLDGLTNALLLLGLNTNFLDTVAWIGRFVELVIRAGFPMLLGTDVDALPCGGCD
jgi:hypothetical protein